MAAKKPATAAKRPGRQRSDPSTPTRDPVGVQPAAISVFILFHLVAITLWALPISSPPVEAFRALVRPYMLWAGLFQNWNMFAPDPMMLNGYVEAEVIYRDGQTRIWSFPRTERLGLVDRYVKERYRKFANEYLRMDTYSGLWPDAARYIARVNDRPANHPALVVLYRYWSQIRPPSPDGSYQADRWMRYRFFLYAIKPGDLE